MTTKAIPRVGYRMRQALMAAVTAPDLLKLLEKVEQPSEGLVAILKQLAQIVKMKPEEGVEPPSLEGVYKSLKQLQGKPEQVVAAIKLLDKIYGKQDGGSAAKVPDLGNLPFFELLRSQPTTSVPGAPAMKPALQAAVGGKPGTYRARLIKAGKALDKKNWKADALQAAVQKNLFEGVPLKVFSYAGEYGPVEYHLPLADADFAGSTVGNQVGFVVNASWDPAEQAVFGDVCITDPTRQALVDAMLSKGVNPPGLSIYCEGDMDDSMDVKEIARVHSMDLVTWPAAEGAILGLQQLQAAYLKVLGAADQAMPQMGQAKPAEAQPVEGAEPTANQSIASGTWKTERNSQLDFFTSLANFVREQIEAGTKIVADSVSQAYDKWASAWEGSQDKTFEEFMSSFWGNPENAALLTQQEQQPEGATANQQPQQQPVQQPVQQKPVQQPLGLEPKKPMTAGSPKGRGGFHVTVNGQRDPGLERRLSYLESRVKVVDSEAMVDQKLGASGLPPATREVIRQELTGRPISPQAVDGVIDSHRKSIATLEASLADSAAIGIEGAPLGGGANAQEAMDKILGLR